MNGLRPKRFVLAIAAITISATVYLQRIRVTAWLWHLRHATAMIVGPHTVPVPPNWYVQDDGSGTELLVRLDTDDHSPEKRIKTHSGILVYVAPTTVGEQDLAFVLSREKGVIEKKGVPVQERTVLVGEESLSCIGNSATLSTHGILDEEPVAWSCSSPGGLRVTLQATDPDLAQAWDIVYHIRKKS